MGSGVGKGVGYLVLLGDRSWGFGLLKGLEKFKRLGLCGCRFGRGKRSFLIVALGRGLSGVVPWISSLFSTVPLRKVSCDQTVPVTSIVGLWSSSLEGIKRSCLIPT